MLSAHTDSATGAGVRRGKARGKVRGTMKLIRAIVLLTVLAGLLAASLPVYAQSVVDGNVLTDNPFISLDSNSFDAAGRLWIFYGKETGTYDDLYYTSSPDYGATWATPTLHYNLLLYPYAHDAWYDGTYVHIIYVEQDSTLDVWWYQRGTPNADGTITWTAASGAVGANSFQQVSIAVNTDGYPWIAMSHGNQLWAVKSSTKDGTWTHERTDVIDTSGGHGKILPLTSNKMAVVYVDPTGVDCVSARRWTGTSWGTAAVGGGISLAGTYMDCAVQDDDVHCVYMATIADIDYSMYQYSTNSFISTTELADFDVNFGRAPAISISTTTNDLFVFFEGRTGQVGTDDHIYYMRYNSVTSTWYSMVDWIDETVMDGVQGLEHMVQEYPGERMVGLYYVAGSGSPYILKYKEVQEQANITTLDPTGITTTQATLRGDITSVGTGSITVRGVQYNTTPSATGAGYTQESGAFGAGVYSLTVEDFEADELYYCRAYATTIVGTIYGEWVAWLSAIQGTGTGPEQPDEPDEGMAPPVDTEGPVNWVTDPTTRLFDNWPFSDVINTFADMVSRSFAWFLFMVFAVSLVGIALCKYTRHLGITFLALGMLLGLYIAGDAIDWWLIFPYLLVGISLIIKEQQYGWG